MSESTLPIDANPTALQRLKGFSRRIVGDIGSIGFFLRLVLLLVFALYFGLPLLWLLIAPSKDQSAIITLAVAACGFARPRSGANSPRRCQISSVMNGITGCSNRSITSSTCVNTR